MQIYGACSARRLNSCIEGTVKRILLRVTLFAAVVVAGYSQTQNPNSLESIYASGFAAGLAPFDSVPLSTPTIDVGGVVSGASFQPGIVPGSWLTIKGSNLSPVASDTWDKAIVDGKLPTSLDGVSVNVGSKPAYVYFISPTQINVQAPDVGTG